MSSKNAVTVSVSSFDPAIKCSSTRRPSTAKPKAARIGSRLAPERAMNGQKGPLRIAFRRMATTQGAGLRAHQLGLQRIGASFVE